MATPTITVEADIAEIIDENRGNYPKMCLVLNLGKNSRHAPVQLKVDLFGDLRHTPFSVGEVVRCEFATSSKLWKGRWFTNAVAKKIESVSMTGSGAPGGDEPPPPSDDDDSIPF